MFRGNLLDSLNKSTDKPSMREYQRKILGVMRRMTESPELRDHGMMGVWFMSSRVPLCALCKIVLFDIDLVRELLAAKTLPLIRKGRSYQVSRPLIGHGVLSTVGKQWRKQRPVVERGFKPHLLSASVGQAVKTAEELILKWKLRLTKVDRERGVDVHEEMLKLTMDVLGRVALGYDFGSVTAPTTAEAPLWNAFDTILRGLSMRASVPGLHETRWIPTKRNREIDAALSTLRNVVESVIKKRTESGVSTTNERDLLDTMLASGDDGSLSFSEVIDNIQTLLFAGHDTTAAALSWLFYHFAATRPDAMQRCREEIIAQCGEHGDPSYESLESMPYLNACVKEILRLYPSAGFTREVVEDFEIGGRVIPAGTEVMVFPWILHRNPSYYDRPNDFIPERWTKDEMPEIDAGHRKAGRAFKRRTSLQAQFGLESKVRPFLPFSLGPRNCVGRPMALMEIRVVLIKLLQHFELKLPPTPDPKYQEEPVVTLTLNPRSIRLVPVARSNIPLNSSASLFAA